MISHGLLVASCIMEADVRMLIFSCILILLNFAVPAKYVLAWPVSKLAHIRNKTFLWAYIFKIYFASSLLLWSFTTFTLAKVAGIVA